jgi:hypothetical protein
MARPRRRSPGRRNPPPIPRDVELDRLGYPPDFDAAPRGPAYVREILAWRERTGWIPPELR